MFKRITLANLERELDFQENLDSGRASEFNEILYESLFEFYQGAYKKLKNHYRTLLNIACVSLEELNQGGQNA